MSVQEIELELPDGTRMHVPAGETPLAVAARIGPGLAKAALGAKIDGVWIDLRAPLRSGGRIQLITARDAEAGELIRHSAEHIMADAVSRLWPQTQIDVGRTDHSEKFQYDLDIPVRVTPDDLPRIEAEMAKIIAADLPFEREVVPREEARRRFEAQGQTLKVARIADLPEDAEITLFRHGDFIDLCRGPHVQRTGQVAAFALTDLAGSYWRGDESNPMLQRIYGVAFARAKDLEAYNTRIEEAKRRDHRRLGAELDLFQFHELAAGSPFYLPKGLKLYQRLVQYIKGLYAKYGYDEVMCPQVFDADLFRISGHYDNFNEGMYAIPGDDGEELFLKPMNCPGHCLLFRSRKRSYRELPLRLAEFSRLHRNERSGTLHGMTRVRSMAQDDAHIFCRQDQISKEVQGVMDMVAEVHRDLGLSGVRVGVSTRPEQFAGSVEDWDTSERLLIEAVERAGHDCLIKPGEGAFYGPKIEYDFYDALGRAWQLSTLQLDVAMPGRFGLRYVGADGAEHQPAMLHRAILGTLERFIGIYLEHTAGALPLWLAPVQVGVLPVSERHEVYAREIVQRLCAEDVSAELDARNETLGYRIRSGETSKVPVLLVVGHREEEERTVTVRRRGRKEQHSMSLSEFERVLKEEINTRGIS